MSTPNDVTSELRTSMRTFAGSPLPDDVARVREFTQNQVLAALTAAGITNEALREVTRHWDEFRRDATWVDLLASVLAMIERQRSDPDAPIPIWSDLDVAGPRGRFFYFYLFALCAESTREILSSQHIPNDVIERTMSVLARHSATHEVKYGTVGVEAGWWLLPTLRAEMLHIGSLQFHYITVGVGTLFPSPWYDAAEAAKRGPGFRQGDASIGLHIPRGTDLDPASIDETFDEARKVLGRLWPATQRRLAICQTWMFDDRLVRELRPDSNIVSFQRRFQLLPEWTDDNVDIVNFVLNRNDESIEGISATNSLEHVVIAALREGPVWRQMSGWLDFDGVGPGAAD
jgi:hypothetical protein